MKVLPNPYALLDAQGRLAGACPLPERVRPTSALPERRYIGARLEQVGGFTRRPSESDDRESRSDRRFMFVGEPVDLAMREPFERNYVVKALRNGSLIKADNAKEAMAQLGKARAKALKSFKANYGNDCNCSEWCEQFPLDGDLAGHKHEPRESAPSGKKGS